MFKKWFGLGKKDSENQIEEQQPVEEVVAVLEDSSDSDVSKEALSETDSETVAEASVLGLESEIDTQLASEDVWETLMDETGAHVAIENDVEENQASQEDYFDSAIDASIQTEVPKKKSWFDKLKEGLTKTSKVITDRIDDLFNNYGQIDEDLYEELEEILIMADIGMETSLKIIAALREELKIRKISDAGLIKPVLRDVIEKLLDEKNDPVLHITPGPALIFVIGVNGAGKTTTIGKLAHHLKKEGRTVVLAAADTFRAAAIDQLKVWGDRAGVPVIAQTEGSDPAAVVFDGIQAAKARKTDVLIIDTAGRLHNKKNLMNELAKIFRVIEREYPEAKREVLLVLDATTGQNGIQQAKLFKEVADLTGIVLTKLDGTAKGGVVLAINNELGIPVKLVGVGEGIDDMQPFTSKEFADALLERRHVSSENV